MSSFDSEPIELNITKGVFLDGEKAQPFAVFEFRYRSMGTSE